MARIKRFFCWHQWRPLEIVHLHPITAELDLVESEFVMVCCRCYDSLPCKVIG